ncbi:MAG: family ATPase [Bacillales bacterium]|jgi:DNA helicase-2/ATP-dependent DNA helicase PcrA|nr:family ATPase [Bacillales bacterium]
MSKDKHPDFQSEQERLDFTRKYMNVVIDTAQSSKEAFLQKMKEVFRGQDWAENTEYSQLLTSANFYQLSKSELEGLTKAYPNPYFARVDFLPSNGYQTEKLYFGKTSLFQRDNQEQIIIDWRAPIANLYYEGRLGKVSYKSEGESYDGDITLKRQIMIQNGEINEIRDIDITTTDELLQDSLSRSSTSRLTEIIATIQEEQNQIIRADLNKPIIVQGAAGSGKTTIALHRISYFLYHYREQFDPRKMLILAPSKLFLEYISEALPEMGADKIRQETYDDFVLKVLGKNLKLVQSNHLIEILEGKGSKLIGIVRLKGSRNFQILLDRYLQHIYKTFEAKEDFFVDKFKLYSYKKFNHLLQNEYWYLPFFKRLDKCKSILQNTVKIRKQEMKLKVEGFYDQKLDRAFFTKRDSEQRKLFIETGIAKKQERLEELHKSFRIAVPNYMKQFQKKDVFDYYDELFRQPELLNTLANGLFNESEINDLLSQSQLKLAKRSYISEDLPAIFYLHAKLNGLNEDYKVKNVVIDEVQDYSFMQLQSLQTAFDTDMFTLVGDLSQGIHSYKSITNWQEILQWIFPRATFRELKKSYRTTIEIMELAKQILKLLPHQFSEVEPVVRHGDKPTFNTIQSLEEFAENIRKIVDKEKGNGYHSFAVICKTMKDCRSALKGLKEYTDLDVFLLEEKTSIPLGKILVVPSYLAKGLEFDVVIAFSHEESFRSQNELELKLLYVVMTRALHRLYFLGKSEDVFLLDKW